MNYCIIADYFREDLPNGGAEVALDALIEILRPDHKLIARHSHEVTPEFVKNFNGTFIVSNRMNLSLAATEELYKKDYILIENDYFYLKSRDAGLYEDFIAPEDQIIHKELYEKARLCVFQSRAQLAAAKVNLKLDNFHCWHGNPWSQNGLDYLKTLQDVPKTKGYAVLLHQYPTKNTDGAVKLCKDNDWPYEIIPPMPSKQFLAELAKFENLVFLPLIFESYGRTAFEMRSLNGSILTNQKLGFRYEEHSRLKGIELIQYAEENNQKIKELFV